MWFLKLIRTFFFTIDNIIYSLIISVYNLIITVSQTSILSQGQIRTFASRIELLLAVFMLFKVSISIITYIVNPDDFSDKSKGFGKLLQNTIISLLLLVFTPYAFSMAYELQKIILEDNSIMTLVFGDAIDNNSNYTNEGGQLIAYSVMIPFFTPETQHLTISIPECAKFINDDGTFNQHCIVGIYNATNGPDFSIEQFNLAKDVESLFKNGDFFKHWDDATIIENYAMGVEKKNYGLTFRLDTVKFTINGDLGFVFKYRFLISTVVAAIVFLILVSFLLDIALRSVKLAFLQLIAPIPIISFMDPKSGKDGMFKKWYQMCFSTYLSLFVRLLAIYFGIYLITMIMQKGTYNMVTGESESNLLVNLILIIGILMFAKQLPKILEGLGIKLDGGGKFQLNPFKKIEEEALGGKNILGAAGGMVSGIADRGARIATAKGAKNKLKAAAGGFIGVPGAAIRGFRDGKGFSSGLKAQNAVNRRLRDGRIKGLTATNSYLDYLGSRFGLDDATLERKSRFNYLNNETYKNMKNQAEEDSRAETFEATKLEHENAQRKETIQRIADAKSKAETVQKGVEDYVKKKANLGREISENDAQIFDGLNSGLGRTLRSDLTFSNGFTLKAGTTIDNSVLNDTAKEIGLSDHNRDDALNYGYASSHMGSTLTSDIKLTDGTVLKSGETINSDMISKIRKSLNKNYTETININENKLEMLRNLQKNNAKLNDNVTIGDITYRQNTVVTAEMVEKARDAAYQYEKYANEQVNNLFESNSIGGNDQFEFNNNRTEFETSVASVNESIDAYNTAYNKSVAHLDDSVIYTSLDNTFKYLKNGTTTISTSSGNVTVSDISDMRTESTNVESEVVRHKQNAANAKDKVKGYYIDENGDYILDAHGNKKEFGLDEYNSILTLDNEEIKREKDKHAEYRSRWQNMGDK